MAERLILDFPYAPGDNIAFTAAVRDLALQYPERYQISVVSRMPQIWAHNPRVVPSGAGTRVRPRLVDKSTQRSEIHASNNEPVHLLSAYHRVLSRMLDIPIKLSVPKPELFLPPDVTPPDVPANSWILFTGWKVDTVVKRWVPGYWQRVVDELHRWGIPCVQVGARGLTHHSPDLRGVIDMRGATNLPQLFALIARSAGVICGATQGPHIAAAFDKPCVVIAGGREPWWWLAYDNRNQAFAGATPLVVPHRVLHTIGMLSCCDQHGCWKHHVSPPPHTARHCKTPEIVSGMAVGRCMSMITPGHVLNATLSYYVDGTLPSPSPQLQTFVDTMNRQAIPSIATPLQVTLPGQRTVTMPLLPTTTAPPAAPRLAIDSRAATVRRATRAEGIDHPVIGGRVTLCVLMYGDYQPLHRRCLDNILRTTHPDDLEIRVGGNALCHGTLTDLHAHVAAKHVQHLNVSPENRKKYPVMHQLFRDPPITTNWTLWFDDDTICDKDPLWFDKMIACAIAQFDKGCRAVAPLYRFTRWNAQWQAWCAAAPWYKGRPWPAVGSVIKPTFPTGSLWLVHTQTALDLGIPDLRLGHNHGDVTIGCQLWQGGWSICNFSGRKEIVNWSSAPRRGITDIHPSAEVS